MIACTYTTLHDCMHKQSTQACMRSCTHAHRYIHACMQCSVHDVHTRYTLLFDDALLQRTFRFQGNIDKIEQRGITYAQLERVPDLEQVLLIICTARGVCCVCMASWSIC